MFMCVCVHSIRTYLGSSVHLRHADNPSSNEQNESHNIQIHTSHTLVYSCHPSISTLNCCSYLYEQNIMNYIQIALVMGIQIPTYMLNLIVRLLF